MNKTLRLTFFVLVVALSFVVCSNTVFAENKDKLTLKVLCDDEAISDKYPIEHGLSIFVELPNGHTWLVDTGTTDIFIQNARLMKADLDHLAGIAITHGHDDHTGGLTFYDRLKSKPPVYGHPYIWHKQYGVKKDKPVRVCGMPYLARKHADPVFKPLGNVSQLDDDFYFFTDVYREPGSYAPTKGKFFNEDGTGPCPITDDATLAIKTKRGIVAIFGCAHAGYVNILKAIQKKFPDEKLLSVVGGLHLKSANEKVLEAAVAYTDKIRADDFTFYGGHCTGNNAIEYFKKKYGEDVVKSLGSGRTIVY